MRRTLSPGPRPAIAAAAAALIATSLAAAAVAGPAGAQTTPTEHFTAFLVLRGESAQPAWSAPTAGGAFDAGGTLRFGADGPHGVHHDILILQNGMIDLAEAGTTDTFTFNPKTCIGSDHETGTYQVTGTGQYANVTGNGSWQHNVTIVAPLQSGCTPNSPGTIGFVRFTASGPINLGS